MSTFKFQKITKDEPLSIKYSNLFTESTKQFTTELYNPATPKSGKPTSYPRYIIKLMALYTINTGYTFTDFNSLENITIFKAIENYPNFPEYNKSENHFPSASIHAYIAYLNSLALVNSPEAIQDTISDFFFINEPTDELTESTVGYDTKRHNKIPKPQKENQSFGKVYPRSATENYLAKKNADWKCAVDNNHLTFDLETNHHYVEAHHLIPMAFQDDFEYSIDFADNLICLCPTCHRKIHLAKQVDREAMIRELFKQREDCYSKHGITINIDNLLSYYGISE